MKTQISFRKTNGSDGVALLDGDASSPLQAKEELANKLELPAINDSPNREDNVNARLQQAGIDPHSIQVNHVSE